MQYDVVELSSYRACSRARGGASFTFWALAILVVVHGRKTQSCHNTTSVPVTAIAVFPCENGRYSWV
jgi:hypothetical protein